LFFFEHNRAAEEKKNPHDNTDRIILANYKIYLSAVQKEHSWRDRTHLISPSPHPRKSVLDFSSCRKHSIEEGSVGEALVDNKIKRIPNKRSGLNCKLYFPSLLQKLHNLNSRQTGELDCGP